MDDSFTTSSANTEFSRLKGAVNGTSFLRFSLIGTCYWDKLIWVEVQVSVDRVKAVQVAPSLHRRVTIYPWFDGLAQV
jgi:hypothetical protein